jgi:hypothetical protein
VHAYEKSVGVDEVEFNIPTFTFDHMDLDCFIIVMARTAVILTATTPDKVTNLFARNRAGEEQIFRHDYGSIGFVKVCPIPECADRLSLCLLEPFLRNIR